ncbi:MAG: hypothetical protein IT452_10440 [Planctomycetia bacterium]|nr:hypothetical protein [Planctomycetia bacterium]
MTSAQYGLDTLGPDRSVRDIMRAWDALKAATAGVVQIEGELSQATANEKALVEKIAAIKKDIRVVEQETLAAGMQRVRLVAEQESYRLAADLRIREAGLIMERAKLQVLRAQAESGNRFSAGTSNILGATAESNQAKVLLEIHTQDARMQEDALQDQAKFARQTYDATVKTLNLAVAEKKEDTEIAELKARALDQLLTATSVEEQLRLLRKSNAQALQQEKEKRDAILGVVLLTTEIESSENSKNLVAQAALSASTLRNLKAKSDLLKQDEATAFRMTAQEKALAAATADVAEANDQIAEKRRRFAEEEARLQEKMEAANKAPGGKETALILSQELFDLQKKHNAELDVDLTKQKKITDELHLQIEAASVRNARQIGDEALPAAQAGAQAQGLQNRAAGTSGITAQRLSTQAELTTARASLEIMRTKAQIQAQALQRELTALRSQQAPLSTIEAKEAEIAQTRALSTVELERQQLAIDGLNAKLDQAATDAKAVALQLGTFIESTFTGLADTLGSALADALDPTKKIDMKERFRAFFAGIFQQLATFLLTVALFVIAMNAIPGFTAVMELMGGMGAAGSAANSASGALGGKTFGGGAVGKAEGGRVGAGGAPSMAHFGARGFAGGGRPAGLDPTDTVAIWAAPDEWVIRAQSARAYGADVMSAINEGMIDPSTLQGLAGAHRVSTATSRSSPGFAAGGRIPARASSPGSGSGGPKILPVMPVSEATLDLMLSVGEGALKRSLKKNASYLRSIIGNSK